MIPSIIALIFVVGIIVIARCFVSPINDGKRLVAGMQESLIASENFQSLRKYGSSNTD
jgi:hypothetical protein